MNPFKKRPGKTGKKGYGHVLPGRRMKTTVRQELIRRRGEVEIKSFLLEMQNAMVGEKIGIRSGFFASETELLHSLEHNGLIKLDDRRLGLELTEKGKNFFGKFRVFD